MKRIGLTILVTAIFLFSNTIMTNSTRAGFGDHHKKPICDEIPLECGGCVWPEYRHDNFNTGYVPKECAPPCDDVFEIWRKVLSPDEHILQPPVVDCGLVFVGTTAGTFYALNASTGITKWVKIGLGAIRTSACVYNRKVYVGTDTGIVYSFDIDTGDLATNWPVIVYSPVSTAIKAFENKIFVGTNSGHLWCFNLNGTQYWSAPIATGGEIVGAPALGYGFIWFGSEDKYLYCAEIKTGKIKPGWPVQAGDPDGSVPSIGNDTLYYKTDVLNPLQLMTGWTSATSAIKPMLETNVALDVENACNTCDTYVYAGNSSDYMYKTSNKSSVKLWSKLFGKIDGINSTPSLTEDRIYFNSNGSLYVIDTVNGQILNKIDVPLFHVNEKLTSIAIAYNRLYFASTSCTVYSYGCCIPFERRPASIILLPNPVAVVKRNCELQFKAIVLANDGTPMPELDDYVEYYSSPSNLGSINVKTGLFKAGTKTTPPNASVWARLRMSYLTNLGNTIDIDMTTPVTLVTIN